MPGRGFPVFFFSMSNHLKVTSYPAEDATFGRLVLQAAARASNLLWFGCLGPLGLLLCCPPLKFSALGHPYSNEN